MHRPGDFRLSRYGRVCRARVCGRVFGVRAHSSSAVRSRLKESELNFLIFCKKYTPGPDALKVRHRIKIPDVVQFTLWIFNRFSYFPFEFGRHVRTLVVFKGQGNQTESKTKPNSTAVFYRKRKKNNRLYRVIYGKD